MNLKEIILKSPIVVLPGEYFVVALPVWYSEVTNAFCITRDDKETTVICLAEHLGEFATFERRGPFSLLRFKVALPFQAPGFLATITAALAAENLSVLVLSTFSFDYVLVSAKEQSAAVTTLRAAGFPLENIP